MYNSLERTVTPVRCRGKMDCDDGAVGHNGGAGLTSNGLQTAIPKNGACAVASRDGVRCVFENTCNDSIGAAQRRRRVGEYVALEQVVATLGNQM